MLPKQSLKNLRYKEVMNAFDSEDNSSSISAILAMRSGHEYVRKDVYRKETMIEGEDSKDHGNPPCIPTHAYCVSCIRKKTRVEFPHFLIHWRSHFHPNKKLRCKSG